MSKWLPTRLESLSNDVLIEIFDYLDGYSLCLAFVDLNERLNGLFRTAPMHLEFDGRKKEEHVWNSLDSLIHPAQIRSLVFRDVKKIDDRFVTLSNVNLVSLIVSDIDHSFLKDLLRKLPKTVPVKHFAVSRIRNDHRSSNSNVFSTLLEKKKHRLSTMVNAVLSFDYYRVDFSTVRTHFLELRRLTLTVNTDCSDLFRFLQVNTPNLRSLKLRNWAHLSSDAIGSDLRLRQILELDMNYSDDYSPISHILQLFPSLKKLHLEWRRRHRSRPFPGGSEWQMILEQFLPNLRRFTLHFVDIGLDQSVLRTFYHNEFWTSRKVQGRMLIDRNRTQSAQVKTISFGRQWRFSHFDQTALA